MFESIYHEFVRLLGKLALTPVTGSSRLFWVYLMTACIFAVFLLTRRGIPIENWLRTLFPAKIYRHRSTLMDIYCFAINSTIVALLVAPITITGFAVGQGVNTLINSLMTSPELGFSGFLGPLYGVAFFLAFDFAQYVAHYCLHRIPWLWEFHKVHHSAETLTPLTAYRFHPVDNIMTGSIIALFTGVAYGLFAWITGEAPRLVLVYGMHVGVFAFYLLGYNLRHSHIWLAYPRWLSCILVSPAMHQIHHSAAHEHWDKNMGYVLSVWDGIFGTRYIAAGPQDITYGIGTDETPEFNRSIKEFYLRPLRNLKRIYFPVAAFLIFCHLPDPLLARDLPSLWLEDLTWPEIRQALDDGVCDILLPTAGTEQNGPHMPLNKHELVLRNTAPRIAETLDNILIAPIVVYVPEGRYRPRTGHMMFPGTISVPEHVFAQVLEHSVRSLQAHGFQRIWIIGDSGGNQRAQKFVARKVKGAFHIEAYYANHQQEIWLAEQGFTAEQIGGHAGLRDTSELMAAAPGVVRDAQRAAFELDRFAEHGAFGYSQLASATLGQSLLSIKVDAAVQAIKQLRSLSPPTDDRCGKQ